MDGLNEREIVWRTDEPCPVCAAGLYLIGYGTPVQLAECRLCGWSEPWEADPADHEETADEETGGDAQ